MALSDSEVQKERCMALSDPEVQKEGIAKKLGPESLQLRGDPKGNHREHDTALSLKEEEIAERY